MPLSLVGDSLAFKFGDYMCIEARAAMHICIPRRMTTTKYAECLEILWQEVPGSKAKASIYKYLVDCKNGKHGKQIAEGALRIL